MRDIIILSGCSGGGKSTLLEHLSKRGFATVEEPGRRVVRRETDNKGRALPWMDLKAFLLECIALARKDYDAAEREPGPIFCDRSLIDAASALHTLGDAHWFETLKTEYRYRQTVFLTPPWPEIYINDAERRHGLNDAIDEYERLLRDYQALGYRTAVLPKTGVDARADFILEMLETR